MKPNLQRYKITDSEYYKLCCGRAGQSKDKASGPLLFQGATLLIMYQVYEQKKRLHGLNYETQ